MAFFLIFLGLLPGFAWLTFYLSEATHPEPRRMIAFTFVVGIAFGFFTIGIEELFNAAAAGAGVGELSIISLIGLALIEEVMKFAAANFAAKKSSAFSEPIDAMIYMIVAALGFATLENIGAVANAASPHAALIPAVFQTISFRFVGATLLHTLTSGIVGFHWARGIVRGSVGKHLAVGFTIATLLHAFFNFLILNFGNLAYSVVFLVTVGFFVLNDFEALKTPKINLI